MIDGRRTLTYKNVKDICRARDKGGKTMQEFANLFGVSVSTISKEIKAWKKKEISLKRPPTEEDFLGTGDIKGKFIDFQFCLKEELILNPLGGQRTLAQRLKNKGFNVSYGSIGSHYKKFSHSKPSERFANMAHHPLHEISSKAKIDQVKNTLRDLIEFDPPIGLNFYAYSNISLVHKICSTFYLRCLVRKNEIEKNKNFEAQNDLASFVNGVLRTENPDKIDSILLETVERFNSKVSRVNYLDRARDELIQENCQYPLYPEENLLPGIMEGIGVPNLRDGQK